MASLDWSQCPAVESVPGKMSGAWVLRGTRMPVAAIFENIEAGASIDDIMEWFDGLDRKQVKAVIEFAVRNLLTKFTLTRRRCSSFSIRRRLSRYVHISNSTPCALRHSKAGTSSTNPAVTSK